MDHSVFIAHKSTVPPCPEPTLLLEEPADTGLRLAKKLLRTLEHGAAGGASKPSKAKSSVRPAPPDTKQANGLGSSSSDAAKESRRSSAPNAVSYPEEEEQKARSASHATHACHTTHVCHVSHCAPPRAIAHAGYASRVASPRHGGGRGGGRGGDEPHRTALCTAGGAAQHSL